MSVVQAGEECTYQQCTGTKIRQRRDLNSRGQSPVDFESTSLTTRTRCLYTLELGIDYSNPMCGMTPCPSG